MGQVDSRLDGLSSQHRRGCGVEVHAAETGGEAGEVVGEEFTEDAGEAFRARRRWSLRRQATRSEPRRRRGCREMTRMVGVRVDGGEEIGQRRGPRRRSDEAAQARTRV